jgi:homoserine O-acetyltransferase/O-succinyltransferase
MSVSRLCAVTLLLALAAGPLSVSVQSKDSAPPVLPGQTEGEFIIKDFHFDSGEVLPELRLHYVTLGTRYRNSSGQIDNVVLLLHSTGSDTTEFFDPDFSDPL